MGDKWFEKSVSAHLYSNVQYHTLPDSLRTRPRDQNQ